MRVLTFLYFVILGVTCPPLLPAQGAFTYDQQSSPDEGIPSYGDGGTMQSLITPWGQSFTPTLAGIDFIRLKVDDANPTDGLGATVNINLRSGSITGALLGTTATVPMANGFRGNPTFFFPSTVSLAPGTAYYFEPIIEGGSGPFNTLVSSFGYPGGSYIYGGSAVLQSDLWFREGTVPEPSSATMLALAGAMLLLRRRKPAACAPPL